MGLNAVHRPLLACFKIGCLALTCLAAFGYLLLRPLSAEEQIPQFINSTHAIALKQWLATQPGLRVATADDCAAPRHAKCSGIAELRKSNRSYQPYYLVGDFNGDHLDDFAVVAINPVKLIGNPSFPDYLATLAVFNGPFGAKPPRPALVESNLYLLDSALFFGPPRPKPYRLLVGGFESEGWTLEPQAGGTGYKCVFHACQGK